MESWIQITIANATIKTEDIEDGAVTAVKSTGIGKD